MEIFGSETPYQLSSDLDHTLDSWRAGEALQQPLTRPARIVCPAEVVSSDECRMSCVMSGRTAWWHAVDLRAEVFGSECLISYMSDLDHTEGSWRAGEALQQPLTRPTRIVGPARVVSS